MKSERPLYHPLYMSKSDDNLMIFKINKIYYSVQNFYINFFNHNNDIIIIFTVYYSCDQINIVFGYIENELQNSNISIEQNNYEV